MADPIPTLTASAVSPPPAHGAGRWIDALTAENGLSDAVIVIGASADDVLAAVCARRPAARIVAMELDHGSAEDLARASTACELTAAGRLRVLVGPAYRGASEAWRLFDGLACTPTILPSPARYRRNPDAVRAGMAVARAIARAYAGNTEARERLGGRYLRQTLLSVPRLADEGDCGVLTGLFAGTPAVVAGAGPSLDSTVAELAGLRDRCVVIAVDTALRPLLHHGVRPDVVVAIDPTAPNARHLSNVPGLEHTWLMAEPSLHPASLAGFRYRTFFGRVGGFHPWPWLVAHGVDRHLLTVWSSVLTAAFDVAHRLGHDPILLVGADLAFGEGRVYCRHTIYEEDWAQSTSHGDSLDNLWRRIIEKQEPVEVDVAPGRAPLLTNQAMLSARDWLVERMAAVRDRAVVNCSADGLLATPALTQGTLRSWLADRPPLSVDVHGRFREAHGRGSRPSPLLVQRSCQFVRETGAQGDRTLETAWRRFIDEAEPGVERREAPRRAAAPMLTSLSQLPSGATVAVVGEFAGIVRVLLERVRPDLRVSEHPAPGAAFAAHRLADGIDVGAARANAAAVLLATAYADDIWSAGDWGASAFVLPKRAINVVSTLTRPLPWVAHPLRLFPSAAAALDSPAFQAALAALADDVERAKFTVLASDPGGQGCLLDRIDEIAASPDLRAQIVDDVLRGAAGPSAGLFVAGFDLSRVSVGIEAGVGTGIWLREILARTGHESRHYAFDPDRAALVHGELFQYLEGHPRLWCSARPLWDRCTEVLVAADGARCAVREYHGSDADALAAGRYIAARSDTVDACVDRLGLGAIDLLAIDVGGSEARVLQGAALTLARSRPQVAVAAYHSPAAHAEVPALLNGLLPGYRFTVANHTAFKPGQKTVVYGVPREAAPAASSKE